MIYHVKETDSTNTDALDLKYREFDVIWADSQRAGRGQRGHKWSSRPGENLTFSVVLEPIFIPINRQFALLEIIALSLVEFFREYDIPTKIKWVNDIYYLDKKIVGILIEHSTRQNSLARTIVGIGINVNQKDFPEDIPNPISMIQLTGKEYNLEEVLNTFLTILRKNYELLRQGSYEEIHHNYQKFIYRKDERHTYLLPERGEFQGIIRDVRPTGELVIEDEKQKISEYLFKQVEFVI